MSWTDSLIGVVQSAPIKESDFFARARWIALNAPHKYIHRMCASTASHPMDVCRLLFLAYTNTLPHELNLSVLY